MAYYIVIRDAALPEEERNFVLNIHAMIEYRRAMLEIGMVHRADTPDRSDWPDMLDAPESDEDDPVMMEPLLSAHPTSEPTIPSYKLGSEEWWIVTPDEIEAALGAWERAADEACGWSTRTIDAITDGYWDEWIAFLRRAARHGGMQVCG